MQSDPAKKSCKMCDMEIPIKSRKCPYCHHFQNRLALFLYHPFFAMLMMMIPFAMMMLIFASMMDKGQNFAIYVHQMVVTNSAIAFGEKKSGPTVAVIGTITNRTPVPWKDVYFHVDFFNSAGKLTDSGVLENYEYYLPANDVASFKVSFAREYPETNYVTAIVRVVGAKDARSQW